MAMQKCSRLERPGPGIQCGWCSLAQKLTLLYRRSGKSLRQLEQNTFISDSTIHRYLTRKTLPPWPVLECLVDALDGQEPEFKLLWERAKADHCTPQSCWPVLKQRTGADSAADDAGHRWVEALIVALRDCNDDEITQLAETIIGLTLVISQASSAEAVASYQAARATCWVEIANHVDTNTPNGQLCAAACREAGRLD
jgi:hypothetical protein